MASARAERLGRAALPILALVTFAAGVASTVAVAGDTLGYDFQAYVAAAERLLRAAPLYDPTVDVAGPFAIYLYPPPFAVAFIPLALFPDALGLWIWIVGCIAMTAAAIALLPVSRDVRWVVLLLAGLDWPVVYAIKLGQVGPLLLLVFAIGWRLLRSDAGVGVVGAAGALIKVQPALVFGWALLTRRPRAFVVGIVVAAAAVAVTLPVVGIAAWVDYVDLLGSISEPVTTPHNMTVGAVMFQAGVSESVANSAQIVGLATALAVWVFAALRRPAEVSFLTTVVASQLLSPLLWDHYAILLLLPVAWLLQQRHWWAAAIPLATSLPLLAVTPPATYPLLFFVALVAPVAIATVDRELAA